MPPKNSSAKLPVIYVVSFTGSIDLKLAKLGNEG